MQTHRRSLKSPRHVRANWHPLTDERYSWRGLFRVAVAVRAWLLRDAHRRLREATRRTTPSELDSCPLRCRSGVSVQNGAPLWHYPGHEHTRPTPPKVAVVSLQHSRKLAFSVPKIKERGRTMPRSASRAGVGDPAQGRTAFHGWATLGEPLPVLDGLGDIVPFEWVWPGSNFPGFPPVAGRESEGPSSLTSCPVLGVA